jgi:3'(2'), 5'-bisphosphate nucleotidase
MSVEDTDVLLDTVIALSIEAGHAIMAVYAQDFSVVKKDDLSPLTEADMAAHHIIVAGLEKLTPELPVLSEESAALPFATRATWNRYWLVDPLDGTREFVKRNGEFTVNIALIENHQPVLGVVYVPVTGVCYYARKGRGAYKQNAGAAPHAIQVRLWNGGQLVVAGSQSHRSNDFDVFLANVGDCRVISIGSSLKSCLVAEGTVHIYPRLGLTSEWDTAAAQCVVEEAGGQLTDTALRPLRYNTKESLLNPSFLVFGDARHDWSKYVPAGHATPV